MKTFEERYTEWIDGQLAGADLAAFEKELSRRAAEGDAQADKAEATALRGLLRECLQAPPLLNEEFFNLQLRERMAAERAQTARPKASASLKTLNWFSWSLPRLAWAGAAAAFVATALYYGMIPPQPTAQPRMVAKKDPRPDAAVAVASVEANSAAPTSESPLVAPPSEQHGPMQLARNYATPSATPLPDFQVETSDDAVSVTPLKIAVPHTDKTVQVLWSTGLNYLPEAPSPEAAAGEEMTLNNTVAPQTASSPAPSAAP